MTILQVKYNTLRTRLIVRSPRETQFREGLFKFKAETYEQAARSWTCKNKLLKVIRKRHVAQENVYDDIGRILEQMNEAGDLLVAYLNAI